MKMKLTILGSLLLVAACAEKPVRLVIDPPAEATKAGEGTKILYEVEDRTTGKNEKVEIPVAQVPSRVVIDQPAAKGQEPIPSATLADKKFAKDDKTKPSMSYLKGLESVEKMYRAKHYRDALIQLAPLVEEYPAQPKLHVMQGTIYKKVGEKKLAYQSYKKALELDKDNLKVQEALDKLQTEMGDVK